NSFLSVSAGFTNNGKILLNSLGCYYGYLVVSTGTLINAASGMIVSDPNPSCIGYNRIDAAIDNQGTILVNYRLWHYTTTDTSSNTGTINIAAGTTYEVYNGVWEWNGGSTSGTGLLSFYSATANFNTATMPPLATYFQSSALGSNLPAISNSKKIRLSSNNTITANLENTDTIVVHHGGNNFNGNFTNTTSSLLLFDDAESNGLLTFANGFTNNGKIHFNSLGCYYGYLIVTSGSLENAVSGEIISDPNASCIGYNRIDATLINHGSLNVNYRLWHYANAVPSVNDGSIHVAAGTSYEVYNGYWYWNGGTTSGTGLLAFYNSTANFNTDTMPALVTYYQTSVLGTSLA